MKKKLLQPSLFIPLFLIAIGLIFIIFSGFSGIRISRQLSNQQHFLPRQTDVSSIQSWMTLNYVSRTYGVPEPEFEKKFGIEPKKYHHASVAQIAKDLNKNDRQFLTEVQTFISEFQVLHTEPPAVK